MCFTNKLDKNRAYEELLKPAIAWLADKDPQSLAVNSGGELSAEGDALLLYTMGRNVRISLKDYSAAPELDVWHHLVLLHYLARGDGTPPCGEWIDFDQIKDGLIRGTRFSTASGQWFKGYLKDRSLEEVKEICLSLGAKETEGRGDMTLVLPFLPHFPVLLNLWEADDEFEATGKLLVDKGADHYLSIEDAITVGGLMEKFLSVPHFSFSAN